MKKKAKIIILVTAAVFMAVILSAGCGDGNEKNDKQEYKELKVGDAAPDFDMELLNGETVKLSDYRGKKPVFINFWATWCGPCVGEMPAIQELSDAFFHDLMVFAINCGEKRNKVEDFIGEKGYTFNVGLDEKNEISEKYPTMGIPYTVIVDAEGIVTSIHLGASGDMFSVYEKDVKIALGASE